MRRMTVLLAMLLVLLSGVTGAFGQDYGVLAGAEREAMSDTFQYALENNGINNASEWVNPDTGSAGTVVPVRTFDGARGVPCREFITTIIIGGREEQGYGTACRLPDGSWQIVAGEQQTTVSPPPAIVYPPPAQYYYYPYDFYAPARIFLSFSYVYRSGHLYRGSYYLDGRSFRHRHPVHIRERVYVGPRVWDHHRWYGERNYRDRRDYRYRADPRDRFEHRERFEQRGRFEQREKIEQRGRFEQRERSEQRDRSKYGKRSEYRQKPWSNPDRGRDDRMRRQR